MNHDGATSPEGRSIANIAADPTQYDSLEVNWIAEGGEDNPNRQLFSRYLESYYLASHFRRGLDVGGWNRIF